MKFLLAVTLLLVALLSYTSAQTQHCISKSFITHTLDIDPSKGFDDLSTIYYDSVVKRQRVDVDIIDPVRKSLQVFLLHDQQKGFEYDKTSGQCRTFPINADLQPFCLVDTANKTGEVTIGGQLKCDVWVEKIRGYTIRLVIAPNPKFGIPVNLISKGGAQSTNFQEWWNMQPYDTQLPDQTVFNLPSACKRAMRESSMEVNGKYTSPAMQKVRGLVGFLSDI